MAIEQTYLTGVEAMKLATHIKAELAEIAAICPDNYHNYVVDITKGLFGHFISVSGGFTSKSGTRFGLGGLYFHDTATWDQQGAELREMMKM